jgi:Protein of unknown function (DUF2905)
MPELGRMLIIAGSLLLVVGLLVVGLGRLHIPLGRLPGDISLRGRNWSFSFPIVTCILLSALLSLVLWLVNRFRP